MRLTILLVRVGSYSVGIAPHSLSRSLGLFALPRHSVPGKLVKKLMRFDSSSFQKHWLQIFYIPFFDI
jgi:hypothetical protein